MTIKSKKYCGKMLEKNTEGLSYFCGDLFENVCDECEKEAKEDE